MNKYLLIGVVAILIIAGGWWYFNQSSVLAISETTQLPTEQAAQQNTGASATPKTRPSASTENYTNADFGISFSHPNIWHCKTYHGVANHPEMYQTICDLEDNETYAGDHLVTIDVQSEPFTKLGDVTVINRSIISGQNSTINVIVSKHNLFPELGAVEYNFAGSGGVKSFVLEAGYGPGKPYATPDEIRKVLDPIAQSVVVK